MKQNNDPRILKCLDNAYTLRVSQFANYLEKLSSYAEEFQNLANLISQYDLTAREVKAVLAWSYYPSKDRIVKKRPDRISKVTWERAAAEGEKFMSVALILENAYHMKRSELCKAISVAGEVMVNHEERY